MEPREVKTERKKGNFSLEVAKMPCPLVEKELRVEAKDWGYWKKLKNIEEWKAEFSKHPDWSGRSTHAMHKDTRSGAAAFQVAFREFCKSKAGGDRVVFQKLFQTIFPRKHRDWSEFETIQDWKAEFDSHPEWAGDTYRRFKFWKN